jgi:hypothetical protein
MEKAAFAPLKIIAQDPADLYILSACLQDSLIPIDGLNYDAAKKCFHIFAHRYQWEGHGNASQRIASRLSIENVEGVQFSGFDPKRKDSQDLYLLTLHHETPYLYMIFSNNAKIRLKTDALKIKLRDVSIPWSSLKPSHA